MTEATMLLEKARSLGAEFEVTGEKVTVSASVPLPADIMEALRLNKVELRRLLIIERAYCLADKVMDALGKTDPVVREINRLAWAVKDLQDAGEPEEVWRPLLEEERKGIKRGAEDAPQTEEQATRDLARTLAKRAGWPALDLGRGEAIIPSEAGWRAFSKTASLDALKEIVEELG